MGRLREAGWLGVCLVGAVVVEPVLARRLPLVRLDLVLLVVVAWALCRGPEAGAGAGLLGGLLQDLLSGHALGLEMGPKVLVGLLSGLWRDVAHPGSVGVQVLAVLGGAGIDTLASWGVRALVGWPTVGGRPGEILLFAFSHAAMAPLVYWAVRRGSEGGRPSRATSR
ncbi:MAG: rod shape-determining protein MreD [Armatimonadetes bacterium]|nr:rod shape-determining protein MreD [Armatimonadota bacterium]MDW8153011.1 rod shape-determining protein MreD [Armatimonadota bacterium]